jgi:hypothetical protein
MKLHRWSPYPHPGRRCRVITALLPNPCRKFAVNYFPVIVYSNTDAVKCVLERSEAANTKPEVVVTRADGSTAEFDMRTVRDRDVFRQLSGVDLEVPTAASARKRGGGRPKRAAAGEKPAAAAAAAASAAGAGSGSTGGKARGPTKAKA